MDDSPDWGDIAFGVAGTTLSVPAIAEKFDVDEDAIEEALLDEDCEVCPGCGWWHWSFELNDYDLMCDDCTEFAADG
jgi:hypothetical protein